MDYLYRLGITYELLYCIIKNQIQNRIRKFTLKVPLIAIETLTQTFSQVTGDLCIAPGGSNTGDELHLVNGTGKPILLCHFFLVFF